LRKLWSAAEIPRLRVICRFTMPFFFLEFVILNLVFVFAAVLLLATGHSRLCGMLHVGGFLFILLT
jgi:hypothetical protein